MITLMHLLQINKTTRRFENIAFSRLVSKAIKQKIELISNLSDKAGFTCFDWFLLDSHTALKVRGFTLTRLIISRTH